MTKRIYSFDGSCFLVLPVPSPRETVIFNFREHQAIIAHAAGDCERLGLGFGVHNWDGWSDSDGQWVRPEESIKMVVWNETITDGGTVNLD